MAQNSAGAAQTPNTGYFALGLLLFGLGLMLFVGLLLVGVPLMLLGLGLAVGPRLLPRRALVPVLWGLIAAGVAFVGAASGGCSTSVQSDPTRPSVRTCAALGLHLRSPSAVMLLALTAGLVAAGIGALAAHVVVRRLVRRRTG